MKIRLSLCLLCFFCLEIVAQEDVHSFQEAWESIVLLKNEQALIPIQVLEKTRVAYLPMDVEQDEALIQVLNRYTKVDVVRDFNNLSSYDLFILGLKNEEETRTTYETYLTTLKKQGKLISLIFGVDYEIKNSAFLEEVDAALYLPKVNASTLNIAAQIIFGGMGSIGRLDRDFGFNPGVYVQGLGIQLKSGFRLAYVPPAMAEMDARLLEDSIHAIVQEGITKGAYPGAQVLVARHGKVVFFESFGHHTYAKGKKVKETDLYDFASVTKVTTALAALMKLHGENQFDLEAPFQQYWPAMEKSNKATLNFRSMLAHNAQLMPWIPYWRGTLRKNKRYPWKKGWSNTILNNYKFKRKTFKRDSSEKYPIRITNDLWLHRDYKKRIYKAIRKSPLNEKEGYVYSGLLFYLLPEMVANLAGQDYENYLQEAFYQPLGATSLGYNPSQRFPLERIVPTENDTFFRMQLLHGTVHDEGAAMMAGVSANAGLFGTANDLAKLFQMYQNYGVYGGRRYIAEASLKEFTRCQFCETGNRRGLGFDKPLIEYDKAASYIAKSAGPNSFGHSGYTGTFVWSDPDSGLLLIFFSNRVFPTRDNRKLYTLDIRPRLHQALYDALK